MTRQVPGTEVEPTVPITTPHPGEVVETITHLADAGRSNPADLTGRICVDPTTSTTGRRAETFDPRTRRTLGRLAVVALLVVGGAVVLAPPSPAVAAGYSVTTVDTDVSPGWHTSLQLDGSGIPVIAYQESFADDLRVLRCDDRACSGGGETLTTLATPNSDGFYNSLQLDATGNPVIASYDATAERLRVLRCDDPVCAAGGDTVTTPDTGTKIGRFASMVLDAAGNPVIAYRNDAVATLDLKVLHCDDPACAPGGDTITSPDTTGDVGWYNSLALDAAGNPVVSYYSETTHDLMVLRCDDPGCAPGGDTVTSPDTTGDTGKFSSLELDAAGNPVVSYFAVSDARVKVLHCDDPACATGGDTINSPDPLDGVGGYTSLELDSEGSPVVSYFDHTRFDLRVARCNDPACAGADEFVEAPDAAGVAGEWTSLALDDDDRPIVAYRSQSAQGLKVAAFGGVGYPIPACALGWWSGDHTTAASFGPDLVGTAGYAPAVSGQGFVLDGDDTLAVDGFPGATTGASVEMWVKPANKGVVQALMSRWDFPSVDDGARAYNLLLDPFGRLVWATDETSLRRPEELLATLPGIFDGDFHHVAATWESGGAMTVYYDGLPVAAKPAQGGELNPATATQLRLGSQVGAGFGFTGVIDEPAAYGCAITPDDIEAIYLVGPAGKS